MGPIAWTDIAVGSGGETVLSADTGSAGFPRARRTAIAYHPLVRGMIRHPVLLLPLLLFASGLGGCLGAVDQAPASGTEEPDGAHGRTGNGTVADRLEASGCREQIGIFPMEDAAVRPYLPEGFEPMPSAPPDLYSGDDPSGQSASLLLVGFSCTEPQQTSLFLPFIPVVPPEEMRVADVYYHAVVLPCIADAGTAAELGTWNVPCSPGTVDIAAQADTPAGALWELAAEGPDVAIRLEGAAPASSTPAGPEWVRLFHVLDQQVCSLTDSRVGVHEHWQLGQATLEVDGTPAFPLPDQPGMSSLGRPGFGMNATQVVPGDPGYVPVSGACA